MRQSDGFTWGGSWYVVIKEEEEHVDDLYVWSDGITRNGCDPVLGHGYGYFKTREEAEEALALASLTGFQRREYVRHEPNCQLGDNWKQCPACVAHLRDTENSDEEKTMKITGKTIAEVSREGEALTITFSDETAVRITAQMRWAGSDDECDVELTVSEVRRKKKTVYDEVLVPVELT